MRKELEEELYEKYPKIFRDKDKSMQVTAMCWGFDHGDGWFDLLDRLCHNIKQHCEQNEDVDVVAEQVKEKFGGLRFYIRGGDEYVHGMIRMAESMSYEICEKCGSTDNVRQTKGWIKTLCEDCYNEYINNRFHTKDE